MFSRDKVNGKNQGGKFSFLCKETLKLVFTKIDLHGIIKLYGPKISCKLLSKLYNYSCRKATTDVGIKL